ncbi:MAG: PilZ domain-containing protein [Desulfobacterales bacterium]|nr:PilZ domain-containing protein [Desulfobacterales bacterium]
MSEGKVFVTDEGIATFICPQCSASRTANVSNQLQIESIVKVKCKCKCGNLYSVLLERRRHYRKKTNFPGVYYYIVNGEQSDRGILTIKDISISGLKIAFSTPKRYKPGHKLWIEFRLDDKHRSLIRKEILIVAVRGNELGAKFCSQDQYDKPIGFYLMY